MKVYTTTKFTGVWPVGVSAVVVAEDKEEALKLLKLKIREHRLVQRKVLTPRIFDEVHMIAGVTILQDGGY